MLKITLQFGSPFKLWPGGGYGGGGYGGRVQGSALPPRLTYGFLMQLVFGKKVWFIGVSYAIP